MVVVELFLFKFSFSFILFYISLNSSDVFSFFALNKSTLGFLVIFSLKTLKMLLIEYRLLKFLPILSLNLSHISLILSGLVILSLNLSHISLILSGLVILSLNFSHISLNLSGCIFLRYM